MPVWELVGYDTDLRQARCREYTTSRRVADEWERIPKLQFTDSGHGIVFVAKRLERGERRKPVIPRMEYAAEHLREIWKSREPRSPTGVDEAVDAFIAAVKELFPLTGLADLEEHQIERCKARAKELS